MMRIWGRLDSINVQKVVWAALELDLPFERIDAGRRFGIVNTPDYLAKNPNGLVPCVEVDGLTLWESNAIVRYLAAKHPQVREPLWPADPAHRVLADRWMDWQTTTLWPAMHAAFHGLVRTEPAQRDDKAIAASVALAEQKMAILDAHLGMNEFLGGADFSMGDIPCGCAAHRWMHMPVAREHRPNLERWHRSIAARPAAAQALILPLT